jgi:hypothetical protein
MAKAKKMTRKDDRKDDEVPEETLVAVGARVPPAVAKELRKLAKADDRKLSAFLRRHLTQLAEGARSAAA